MNFSIDLSISQFLIYIWIHAHAHIRRSVPDPRALKILGEFSPLVEIGAGNG